MLALAQLSFPWMEILLVMNYNQVNLLMELMALKVASSLSSLGVEDAQLAPHLPLCILV